MKDIIGKRFSNLTVIKKTDQQKGYEFLWECKCDCGNTTTGSIYPVLKGKKKSCGCQNPNKFQDLTGKTFDKLTVISFDRKETTPKGYRYYYWNCQCDCGNTTSVERGHLLKGKIRSCGCLHHRQGNEHPSFTGYGEIWGGYFSSIKSGANDKRARKIEFNLTIEYLWELFLKQNRKCSLTGRELSFDKRGTYNQTASLDRIDSSKGYVKGNVQWVHKDINRMKSDFDQKKFIELCGKVYEQQNVKT
jgi:hypothetical protein